jgi:acyl dehydratase
MRIKPQAASVAIDATSLLKLPATTAVHHWSEQDFICYALCMGLGDEPNRADRLTFVYGTELRVLPTFPTVIAWTAPPTFTQLGLDPMFALHGEQRIYIHRPITGPVSVRSIGRVTSVRDKGVGRGAVVVVTQEIVDCSDESPIATLTTSCFGRREGGCGDGGAAVLPLSPVPDRLPDRTVTIVTAPDLALRYRLTGDRNPLHADPAFALAAGFARPILHGLCGFGMTCTAVLEAYADTDPKRIASHQARFAAPVFPGDVLLIDLWKDGEAISFQARVPERNEIVISHGRSEMR